MVESTLYKLYFYKLSQERPRPQVGETKVHQVFLKNDVLRESSGPWYQAKRGLIIYDTATMPIHINNNFFYDFPATPDSTPVSFEDDLTILFAVKSNKTEYISVDFP